ncbi:MAG: cadherin domain-containing protein [Akkermansiaceae bacterium]|nr:cadherin domain-containing protein [Akkermansiaceae bacterium]
MPVRTQGLVPACLLVVTALIVWIGIRSVPDVPNERIRHPAAADGPVPATRAREPAAGAPDAHTRSVALGDAFPASIVSKDGTFVTIPLPGGAVVEGRPTRLRRGPDGPRMVEGVTTRPPGGRFYFERQTAPGKAGPVVGYLHFQDEETAYRVVPDPADPQRKARWERTHMDHVVCRAFAPPPDEIPPTHPTDDPIPPDENGIVQLQSLPGATAVIYLDFDGETRDFTSWGSIAAAAPDVSNAQIFEVWKGVCEDFQPFDLNITTIRAVYDAAPPGRKMQVVISPTNDAAPGAGGVAYVGSFNWTAEVVCWSFYAKGKNAVEVISHEIGHTLGLSHDGRSSPSEPYYAGADGWAPIMGVGYYQPLSQWSKGEYLNATNTQDDIHIIATGNNHVSWREDDHGASFPDASWLEVSAGGTVDDEGFIGTVDDDDAFRFTTSGGLVSLDVRNVSFNANLDVKAEIVDAAGDVVAASDPEETTDGSFFELPLAAGDYLLRVSGTGRGSPAAGGYSDYASLGAYTVTGNVAGGVHAERLAVAENSPAGTFVGTIPARADHGEGELVYSMLSGNEEGVFAIDPATGAVTVADGSSLDFEVLSTRWDDPAELECFVSIDDSAGTASETIRVVITVVDANEAPWIEASSPLVLLERLQPGTSVARVDAGDPDRADRLNFSIVGGNSGGAFAIDTLTGEITTIGPLDFETTPTDSLTIRVTDSGSPPMSADVSLTVSLVDIAEDLDPGGIIRTFYEGILGNAVASLQNAEHYPERPHSKERLDSFDGGTDHGEAYGSVMRGYLVPPVSGDYTFWIASDDWGELWISPASGSADLVKRAEVVGWTDPHEWDRYLSQMSVPVSLVAGQAYRIEALHKEGGGGDHIAVAWQGPGVPRREVIPGRFLVSDPERHAPWMDPLVLTVRESADPGQRISDLPFVEPDPLEGVADIAIISGNGEGAFSIHPFTKELMVADGSVLGAGETHYLTIRATDSGSPPLSGDAEVIVRVVGLNDELFAWWKFDETSGNAVVDHSGNNRTAALEGGVTRIPRAPADGAVELDGGSGRVEYLGEDGLAGADSFTLATWVRIPPAHAAVGMLIQQREVGAQGYLGQFRVMVKADGRMAFSVYGRDENNENEAYQFELTSSAAVADGAWHHVACVRDGNDGKIYVDGELSASGSGPVRMLDPSLTIAVGYDARDANRFLAGDVDDVRIYQDALGGGQIERVLGTPRVAVLSPGAGKVGVAPDVGLILDGVAMDPDGALPSSSWTQVSGPAAADMETVSGMSSEVRFRVAGEYRFRFSATDGTYGASRDVTVTAGTTAITRLEGAGVGESFGSHWSPAPGSVTLGGSSSGIEGAGQSDGFYGFGQDFTGDFDIRARIDSVSDLAGSSGERAGLIVRTGGGDAAAGAFIGWNADGTVLRIVRATDGGANMATVLGSAVLPQWFRMTRTGGGLSFFRSNDGAEWIPQGSLAMPGTVKTQLCWSSGHSAKSGSAAFTNVSGFCDANIGPVVSISPLEPVPVGSAIPLLASVVDDGMPAFPGSVDVEWLALPPSVLAIDSSREVATFATAGVDGFHQIRLTADDGDVTTFTEAVARVRPEVSVTAIGSAAESGPVDGSFLVSRGGSLAGELEVSFDLTGSAVEGDDYVSDPRVAVVIPDGSATAVVAISPIADTLVEGDETVELVLLAGDYVATGGPAVLTIADSNHAPAWIPAQPFETNAVEEVAYSVGLSSFAADPDGDVLVFSRVSGPSWLSVASNGTVSGTPSSSDVGTHGFTVRATDPGGLAADLVVAVTVFPGTLNFENWRQVEFGNEAADASVSGDLSDPDHDSLPNLVEYALGTDPTMANTSGISIEMADAGGRSCLRIRVPLDANATDVDVAVEGTGNPDDPDSWSTAGMVVESSTPALLVVRDSIGGPRRFLRVRVSR